MGLSEKSDIVTREWVAAFNDAYARRHMERLEAFLDDDVHWSISGPIDLMPFCGDRRGKRAVLEMVDCIAPRQLAVINFAPELVLIDGDRVSTLCRATGHRVDNGRTVGWRVAQFMHLRDQKMVEYRSIIDSFDAAEQVLGHSIELASDRTAVQRQALGG